MEQYSQALRGKFIVFPFCSLYKTNRFQVAVHLFSNRSQKTSKCGEDISDTLACGSCATFLFLPHFDVICDLLLNRRTATWNLFVKLNLAIVHVAIYCMTAEALVLHVHVHTILIYSSTMRLQDYGRATLV